MRNKILGGVAAFITVLSLVGCGADPGPSVSTDSGATNLSTDPSNVDGDIAFVPIDDGRGDSVDCVIFDAYDGGGSVTCNWDAYNNTQNGSTP